MKLCFSSRVIIYSNTIFDLFFMRDTCKNHSTLFIIYPTPRSVTTVKMKHINLK